VILDPKFANAMKDSPLFSADDFDALSDFLASRLGAGEGMDVLGRVLESRYRPSRKLMNHVSTVIKDRSDYILLDDQLIVYDKVVSQARKGFHNRKKVALIIKGGPGTGKSVVAINLMADLLRAGYNAQYATGSRAFTETLRKVVGSRGAVQFNYFMSYGEAEPAAVDVLICDEAHRLRKKTVVMYKKSRDITQIEEVLRASKVSVFFIDDLQVVRPDEVGSVEYIREAAEEHGCEIHEYQLDTQFRCSGSGAFVSWIDNTLGIRRTPHIIWNAAHETFDFRIFPDPLSLEDAIREKVDAGTTARMSAGFCWPWSKRAAPGGWIGGGCCDRRIPQTVECSPRRQRPGPGDS
jgi:thymidine kinase